MAEPENGWSPLQRIGAAVSVSAFVTAAVVAGLAARDWTLDDPAWLGARPWVVGPALMVGLLGLVPALGWAEAGTGLTLFLFFAVPAVLCTALTTQDVLDVRQWLRTDQSVTVTLSGCHRSGTRTNVIGDYQDTNDVYDCTYSWTAGGRNWEQVRTTEKNHRDGYRTDMWTDPSTGELADHSIVSTAWGIFWTGVVALPSLFFGPGLVFALYESRLLRRPAREVRDAA
ncbi:hypothetical protein [Kitasatospora cathayae]|uniref:DUF3592 domain-containing protein n=1 Tax=Kitasatospora cathayae TaxID=3004092 RepID=A0ABY7PYN2_9ACTN|nr:hypothetical protein [Kitasatospora sp. HUAS 3-15]WBP85548.1 hypothetical protein O1G21_06580 [Kitasatospora sp. HUAS 3-15]